MAVTDIDLIELVYSASLILMVEHTDRDWDQPIANLRPAEIERECYRLATEFGLKPIVKMESLDQLLVTWRRQLRTERRRDIFDIGGLLIRQHALISYLQCHPTEVTETRIPLILKNTRDALTQLFTRYKLTASLLKLPPLPAADNEELWMTWSGDALRDSVVNELGEQIA